MATVRPFLSYSSANRELVEQVAARLATRGFLPIYDHWWMRSQLAEALGGAPGGMRDCRRLAELSEFTRLGRELDSEDDAVRREAAILLALLDESLGPPLMSVVVKELERALESVEAERAILALGKLRADSLPAIEGLIRFAQGAAATQARARAVVVLGRLGPRAECVSALMRVATRARGVRQAAVTELGHMGAAAAAAVPLLARFASAGGRHQRLVALTALGKIGECRCEVLVAVLRALAATERQGIAPSQLHYNAMCVLNQLAPGEGQLARALVPAHRQSMQFAEWLREEFPETAAAIREAGPDEPAGGQLVSTARVILRNCKLVGGQRPV